MLDNTNRQPRRCCFIGPEYEKMYIDDSIVKEILKKEIANAVEDGITTFVTGMSKGVDLYGAEIVLDMREHDPRIKLICVAPYKDSNYSWQNDWKQTYNFVWAMADFRKIIQPQYLNAECYEQRTRFIAAQCERCIMIYGGEYGDIRTMLDACFGENANSTIKKLCIHSSEKDYTYLKDKFMNDYKNVKVTDNYVKESSKQDG